MRWQATCSSSSTIGNSWPVFMQLLSRAVWALLWTDHLLCSASVVPQFKLVSPNRCRSLLGKTFLVTGSTDGIGRHTATRLAGEGATVLIHGR